MDFFIKSFPDSEYKQQENDRTAIADAIGVLIEKTTWEIFLRYRNELLAEEITYIVPAICGAEKNNELTSLQKEIHDRISPKLQEIFGKLGIDEFADSRSFAIRYIIRYTMITKIIYIIESFRNKFHTHSLNEQNKMILLKELAPYGQA
jgi:hypothetical protein